MNKLLLALLLAVGCRADTILTTISFSDSAGGGFSITELPDGTVNTVVRTLGITAPIQTFFQAGIFVDIETSYPAANLTRVSFQTGDASGPFTIDVAVFDATEGEIGTFVSFRQACMTEV
jgi:hypothetical protein